MGPRVSAVGLPSFDAATGTASGGANTNGSAGADGAGGGVPLPAQATS